MRPSLFSDVVNPQFPDGLVGWHVVMLVALVALPLAALISLVLTRGRMTTTQVVIWVAVIVLAPVLGSLVWFAFGLWFHRSRGRPGSEHVPPEGRYARASSAGESSAGDREQDRRAAIAGQQRDGGAGLRAPERGGQF